jgi:hypothetical protein
VKTVVVGSLVFRAVYCGGYSYSLLSLLVLFELELHPSSPLAVHELCSEEYFGEILGDAPFPVVLAEMKARQIESRLAPADLRGNEKLVEGWIAPVTTLRASFSQILISCLDL